jgi:hypothetical protein
MQQHEKEVAAVQPEGSFVVLMFRLKVGEVENRRPLCQQRLQLGFCRSAGIGGICGISLADMQASRLFRYLNEKGEEGLF